MAFGRSTDSESGSLRNLRGPNSFAFLFGDEVLEHRMFVDVCWNVNGREDLQLAFFGALPTDGG